MKAIMVMFDSLNRHMLPNYGCDFVHAPNFKRLGEKTVTFDNCYAGSLPCMPARRELHTGRYNFLHRSWGPIEPFDDSMPEILKNNGIYTHLISDHGHYWEDGGATYHTRYNSWEISRGQEGDPWKGEVKEPEYPEYENDVMFNMAHKMVRQDTINRKYMEDENKQPQAITFEKGLEFIEKNKDEDNWFLQIETFDPHEPFFTQQKYKDLYPHDYKGKFFDWPPYYFVEEDKGVVQHVRYQYAALLSMCDAYLGKVIDMMDANDMWKDTMLIVNTDHGYLLGEHGWWSKTVMPVYNEIAHMPFFIWDPRTEVKGERRKALVQTIDIAPTLLDYFGVHIPESMEGKPLKEVIETDRQIRKAALFGMHGSHVICTDGRYVYMRGSQNRESKPLYEYTLMPTHMRLMFKASELQNIELQEPFDFTKGCKTMKIEASSLFGADSFSFGTKLFDLKADPNEEIEIEDLEIEAKMIKFMVELMKKNDAPKEQYQRLGLPQDGQISIEELKAQKENLKKLKEVNIDFGFDVIWDDTAKLEFYKLIEMTPEENRNSMVNKFKSIVSKKSISKIDEEFILDFVNKILPEESASMVLYGLRLYGKTR